MADILLNALISQLSEEFDAPIIIMPSSMIKKKKKFDDGPEEDLPTRLAGPSPTGGGTSPRIPSPVPG